MKDSKRPMPQLRFIDRPGGRLGFQQFGQRDARVIVLLHCIGLDGRMWIPVIEHLETRYNIIIPDFRGHGGSAICATPFGVEDLASDVVALLDALGVSRGHLVGCSLGANVAMYLAAHHPERWSSIILANGPAKLLLPRDIARSLVDRAGSGDMAALANDMAARWVSEGFRQEDPGFADLVAMMAACPGDAFAAAFEALLRSDRTADLGRIAAPTLVVAGATDPAFDGEDAQAMASIIPNAHAVVVKGALHLAPVEQPRAFATCLEEIVRQAA